MVLKVPLAEPTCVVLSVGKKHTSPSTSTKQRKHGPHESPINLGLQVACPKNGVLTDRLETVAAAAAAAAAARKTQGKDDHHTIDPANRPTPHILLPHLPLFHRRWPITVLLLFASDFTLAPECFPPGAHAPRNVSTTPNTLSSLLQ